MDISNFMAWFIDQVIRIFTFCFTTLDSITFLGTSLFKVILGVIVLGALLPVIMTLPKSAVDSYSARSRSSVKRKDDSNDNK